MDNGIRDVLVNKCFMADIKRYKKIFNFDYLENLQIDNKNEKKLFLQSDERSYGRTERIVKIASLIEKNAYNY